MFIRVCVLIEFVKSYRLRPEFYFVFVDIHLFESFDVSIFINMMRFSTSLDVNFEHFAI